MNLCPACARRPQRLNGMCTECLEAYGYWEYDPHKVQERTQRRKQREKAA